MREWVLDHCGCCLFRSSCDQSQKGRFKVVKRFDVTEFPRSIRWDYNHEYTKGSSVQNRDRLFNELTAESQASLDEVAAQIRRLSGSDTVADTNEESNKHFLLI